MKFEEDIEIQLTKIAEVPDLSHISKRALRRFSGASAKVSLSARLIPAVESNRLSLLLSAIFTDVGVVERPVLMQETVLAEFDVTDIENHIDLNTESIRVPRHMLTLMLSVALGALRGMVALRTAGTPLASCPLPIMDITDIAARIHNPAAMQSDVV